MAYFCLVAIIVLSVAHYTIAARFPHEA